MEYVSIDHLKPGMKLGEDIYDNSGNLLIAAHSIVSPDLLERIRRLNLKVVVIENEKEAAAEATSSEEVRPDAKGALLISDEDKRIISSLLLNTIKNCDFFGRSLFKNIKNLALKELLQIGGSDRALYVLSELSKINTYTIMHSIRCGLISSLIAEWQELPEEKQIKAFLCGLFSQAGKIAINRELLLKNALLSEAELREVRSYIEKTPEVLAEVDFIDSEVMQGIMQSNERADGSGYPMGLTDKNIHPLAKIVAVANVFDAAINKKSYKGAISLLDIVDELSDDSHTKLSPHATTPLIRAVQSCYPGLRVLLSDGRIGEIVFMNKFDPNRPLVRVGEEILDLSMANHDISIVKMEEVSL